MVVPSCPAYLRRHECDCVAEETKLAAHSQKKSKNTATSTQDPTTLLRAKAGQQPVSKSSFLNDTNTSNSQQHEQVERPAREVVVGVGVEVLQAELPLQLCVLEPPQVPPPRAAGAVAEKEIHGVCAARAQVCV